MMGGLIWLQYKTTYTFLFFFKKERWVNVPVPYYHKVYKRNDVLGYNTFFCSYNDIILDDFVKKWPNIEDYLQHYQTEQAKLESEVAEYWVEHNKKKGITYL